MSPRGLSSTKTISVASCERAKISSLDAGPITSGGLDGVAAPSRSARRNDGARSRWRPVTMRKRFTAVREDRLADRPSKLSKSTRLVCCSMNPTPAVATGAENRSSSRACWRARLASRTQSSERGTRIPHDSTDRRVGSETAIRIQLAVRTSANGSIGSRMWRRLSASPDPSSWSGD